MPDYSDKALQTRERILSSAAALFYQNGYNATGLERVISAAGVTKGNFYYYFKSKEALAVETLRWHQAQTREALGLNAPLGKASPLQRLFTTLQHMRDLVLMDRENGESGVRGCYYGNLALELSGGSELVRKELVTVFDGIRAMLTDLLERARQAGEVSVQIDPARSAAMILNLVEGAVLVSKTAQNLQELDSSIEFIRDYLTR